MGKIKVLNDVEIEKDISDWVVKEEVLEDYI